MGDEPLQKTATSIQKRIPLQSGAGNLVSPSFVLIQIIPVLPFNETESW